MSFPGGKSRESVASECNVKDDQELLHYWLHKSNDKKGHHCSFTYSPLMIIVVVAGYLLSLETNEVQLCLLSSYC